MNNAVPVDNAYSAAIREKIERTQIEPLPSERSIQSTGWNERPDRDLDGGSVAWKAKRTGSRDGWRMRSNPANAKPFWRMSEQI